MDLCTAWKVLSVKLSLDKRPQVLSSLCQLFSVVPNLAANSSDYRVRMVIPLVSQKRQKRKTAATKNRLINVALLHELWTVTVYSRILDFSYTAR